MVARMRTLLCSFALLLGSVGLLDRVEDPSTDQTDDQADDQTDGPTVETAYMCRVCYKGQCRYVHCKE
jgi:hypothetical protein